MMAHGRPGTGIGKKEGWEARQHANPKRAVPRCASCGKRVRGTKEAHDEGQHHQGRVKRKMVVRK